MELSTKEPVVEPTSLVFEQSDAISISESSSAESVEASAASSSVSSWIFAKMGSVDVVGLYCEMKRCFERDFSKRVSKMNIWGV